MTAQTTERTERIILQTIEAHQRLVTHLGESAVATIARAAEMIAGALENGGTVYICGNGGSAADAQHIAGELIGRFTRERRALPADPRAKGPARCGSLDRHFHTHLHRQRLHLSESLRTPGRGPCPPG